MKPNSPADTHSPAVWNTTKRVQELGEKQFSVEQHYGKRLKVFVKILEIFVDASSTYYFVVKILFVQWKQTEWVGLHKVDATSLCSACGVINLFGTGNSGCAQVCDTVGRKCWPSWCLDWLDLLLHGSAPEKLNLGQFSS